MDNLFLVPVLFFMDGSIVLGGDIDGWHGKPQPDMKTCIIRMYEAAKIPPPKGVARIQWYCAKKLPEGLVT